MSIVLNGTTGITSTGITETSDGNVGINTSSPDSSNKLQVTGDIGVTWATDKFIGMKYASGTSYKMGLVLKDSTRECKVWSQSSDSDDKITFYTGSTPSERARIDSSGNLMVGTTSTSQSSSNGVKVRNYGSVFVVNDGVTGGGDGFSYYQTSANAYRFYVNNAGQISATNTSISAISDQRYKENIRDLDVGLDAVMQLRPRKFDWKEGKGANIKNARGFIAQEFEEVFPDLIDEWRDPAPEGEEPYKSVRQDLIPVLVKAIQEQQAIIDELTARVSALEAV
jgi:hypothetical protein